MNNDLISREALKKAIIEHRYDYVEDNFFWTKLFNIIDNAPTVETKIIELFKRYDVLVVPINGQNVPVKNTTKQECYDLLFEIQELINWRKMI